MTIKKLGLDKAVTNFLFAKTWNLISLPVTIISLIAGLTKDEQGYYASFAAIQSLQLFFELGMAGVVVQFVAHEKAFLSIGADGSLQGSSVARERLKAIFQFVMRYYVLASIGAVIFLISAGSLFFSSPATVPLVAVNWFNPWLLTCIGTCLGMIVAAFAGVADGLGEIARVHRIALIQNFIGNIVLWVGLWSGAKLYAPALQSVTVSVVGIYFFFTKFWVMISTLLKEPKTQEATLSWRKEIWPLQWRISCSWVAGYFIGQLVSPVIFRYWGPSAAGAYGLTARCVDALTGLGGAWISTRASLFGRLLARKNYPELLRSFKEAILRSVLFYITGAVAFILLMKAISVTGFSFRGIPFAERFLPSSLIVVMVATGGVQLVVTAIATLTRAEKKEPFFWPSILGGILTACSVFTIGVAYGVGGIAYSALILNGCLGLPIAVYIFNKFSRRLRQAEEKPLSPAASL